MARLDVGGVGLFYEVSGSGPPLVLTHGSWVDHSDWSLAAQELARDFRVLTYDRRGHSLSARPAGQGSIEEDADDLAAMIEHLGAPAHVAGNSFGAAIAVRLAGRRPELFLSLNIHEPPLFGLIAEAPETRDMVAAVRVRMGGVIERLARGEFEAAAERFVDDVALGPGVWATLPAAFRALLINNAPTFLDETREPDALTFDPTALRSFSRPLLITGGSDSPPAFAPVLDALARALPQASRHTFEGAGHLPHQSHTADYAARVRAFVG